MRMSICAIALAAVCASFALVPASASAAVGFGDTCIPNETEGGDFTVTTISAPPGPQVLAPSAGSSPR